MLLPSWRRRARASYAEGPRRCTGKSPRPRIGFPAALTRPTRPSRRRAVGTMRRFLAGVSRRFSVVSVWLRRDCDALPHLVSRMAPSHWSKDRNEHAEHETLHWISFYNG